MKRADLLLLVLAGALIGGLYAHYWTPPTQAQHFELREGDRFVGRFALDPDREIEVEGRLGVTRIEVRDGRLRFRESPCRNKICIHSGWLSHSGDGTACLPNRVSAVLLGNGGEALDAVSF